MSKGKHRMTKVRVQSKDGQWLKVKQFLKDLSAEDTSTTGEQAQLLIRLGRGGF